MLALTQESCTKYYKDLKDDGILLADADAVTEYPEIKSKIYKVPIISIAKDEVGRIMVANIVALGIIAEITNIVSIDALESAILSRVPKGTEKLNVQALKIGRETGKNLLAA